MKTRNISLTLFAATVAIATAACSPLKLNENNIDKVLGALTSEEKVHLLVGGGHTEKADSNAVAMIAACEKMIPGCAGYTYPIPRLGVPAVVLADGPAGLRIAPRREGVEQTFFCTGFPIGSLLSSSWNQDLMEEVAGAIGEEVRDYGVDVLLAPGLNLQRNPLCGRNFEYFSEDPLLTGKMAAAYVRGVQSKGVGTSIKHFAANNQEVNRFCSDSRVSVRAMRELYLRGFEIAVKESQPWTLMTSYNRFNGLYTPERRDLLEDVLRKDFGFEGLVMSDWGSGYSSVAMVSAGNDLIEPGSDAYFKSLLSAVENGDIDMDAVDQSVKRVLKLAARSPRGKGKAYSNAPDLESHAEIARRAATEGMILLKNEAALPLAENANIAIFGTNSYKLFAGGTGAGDVNKAYVINLPEGLQAAGISLDAELDAAYRDFAVQEAARVKAINDARGWWFGEMPYGEFPADRLRVLAAGAAERTDAAVITIVRQAGEGKDRLVDDDYVLTASEKETIAIVSEAFHAKGKTVTVVLNTTGIVEPTGWQDAPDAILLAWQPGQEAGYAIADILSGKVSPSGRLPITIPNTYAAVPSQNFAHVEIPECVNGSFYHFEWGKTLYDIKDVDYIDYTEDIYVGYRYYSSFGVDVAYPFGYGLSYTDFDQEIVSCKPCGRDAWTVKVKVTNTGAAAGKEVVQLYSARTTGGNYPSCELRAFAKTDVLSPGASCTVSLKVTARDLASYDESKCAWTTPAGEYRLSIARNAAYFIDSVPVQLKEDFELPTTDSLHPTGPEGKGIYIDSAVSRISK